MNYRLPGPSNIYKLPARMTAHTIMAFFRRRRRRVERARRWHLSPPWRLFDGDFRQLKKKSQAASAASLPPSAMPFYRPFTARVVCHHAPHRTARNTVTFLPIRLGADDARAELIKTEKAISVAALKAFYLFESAHQFRHSPARAIRPAYPLLFQLCCHHFSILFPMPFIFSTLFHDGMRAISPRAQGRHFAEESVPRRKSSSAFGHILLRHTP